MSGIFSGLGFSSSSKKNPNNNEDKPATSSSGHKEFNTDSTQENSGASPSSDINSNPQLRNDNMRLSKSTPPKKTDDDFDIPSESVVPSFGSKSNTNSGSRTSTPTATIGPKITFKGELTGDEDLVIQGKVEGTIDMKDNQLTIGEHGDIKANLMARAITVEGKVEGDLIGQEKIEIKSTSNVVGNLTAERVTLEDGAKFRGSIDMGSRPSTKGSSSSSSTAKDSNKPASSDSSKTHV